MLSRFLGSCYSTNGSVVHIGLVDRLFGVERPIRGISVRIWWAFTLEIGQTVYIQEVRHEPVS